MSSRPGPGQDRTFVGFGFGAIQAGLFLVEAQASGAFARLVVAEVLPEVVAELRANGGRFTVNVAHADGIEQVVVGPVEVCNPAVEGDRAVLVEAIAQAHELATAVPSVRFYTGEGPGSIHRLLAAGLECKRQRGGPPAVLYAAENHNHAAEILRDAVAGLLEDAAALESCCFANTVIGKMSGAPVLEGNATLAPMVPGSARSFLVEAFNRILISQARLPSGAPVERGIRVFVEKLDLLPFEEAKLYVHNALHAMAAYLGAAAGLDVMSDLPQVPAILAVTRQAVLEESGAALIRRYAGSDALFTQAGMEAYIDDLFERMVNPFLRDRIDRVGRDPERKLAWEDRLIGAMRLARAHGLTPTRLALGAAAAFLQTEFARTHAGAQPGVMLPALWQRPPADAGEVAALCTLINGGMARLEAWRSVGFSSAVPF